MIFSGGVTPVESAFTIIGLVNCKYLMDFIFRQTPIGAIIFLIGLFASILEVRRKGRAEFLWHYLWLFFGLWLVFVAVSRPVPQTTSRMEAAGTADTSTATVMNQYGSAGGQISPAVAAMVEVTGLFFDGCVSVITPKNMADDFNYLINPFLLPKAMAVAKNTIAEGILTLGLRKELRNFIGSAYGAAVAKYERSGQGQTTKDKPLWPGDPRLYGNMTPRGRTEWGDLDQKLRDYAETALPDQIKSILSAQFNDDASGSSWQEMFVKSLFTVEGKRFLETLTESVALREKQSGLAMTGEITGRLVAHGAAYAGAAGGLVHTETLKQSMLGYYPFVVGYAIMFTLALFPFTLIICIVTRTLKPLVMWGVIVIWVKSWNLTWALLYYGSLVFASVANKIYPGSFGLAQAPFFWNATNYCIIMAPVISLFTITGSLWGVGALVTAVTLHSSKQSETTISNVGSAAKDSISGGGG